MTVSEMIAALSGHDPDAEVFVATSTDGTRIDGSAEIEHVEALPIMGGPPVLSVVPRYAAAQHADLWPRVLPEQADDKAVNQ